MDAATADSLSRQNSIDTETTPATCKSCGKVCVNLKEDTDPSSPSLQEAKLKYRKTESPPVDTTHICVCNDANSPPILDDEDVKNVVHEILNSIINQISDCEDSHVQEKTAKPEGTPILLKGSLVSRDMHSVSPVSEDSGIGCSLGHVDDHKAEDPNLADHSVQRLDNQLNDSGAARSSVGSAGVEHDECKSAEELSGESAMSVDKELEHSHSSSLFAAFSSNVKYWLGQGNYATSGEFELCGSLE